MLARKFRLSRLEIEECIKKGVSLNGLYFYIKASSFSDRKNNGFSIIISKKVEKTSVGRHRIKRIVSFIIEKTGLYKKETKFNGFLFILKQKENKGFYEKELGADVENTINRIV
jgi:ribonuclease P protein component